MITTPTKGIVNQKTMSVQSLEFNFILLFLFCRNLMLKVSVLGVLCYHWLSRIATNSTDYIKVTRMMHYFQNISTDALFLAVETSFLIIVFLPSSQCWESFVGQELYRFLVVDFIFTLLDTLFGELLWRWVFCQ